MRPNAVKRLLRAGKPAVGTWLTLGNVTAARFLARAGFDFLTVDVEHSSVGIETAAHLMGSVADAGCTALARVPSNRHDQIKRVLDTGAHGVVVPMVNTRPEAEAAASACRYPPAGTRSVGGSVHALNFGTTPTDYFAHADAELLVVLQCEHVAAVNDFDRIYSVGGVDAVFVGPNDLAASMRAPDGRPPDPDAFRELLADVLAGCRRLGIAAGIHTSSAADAKARMAEGWQLVAVNSDLTFMTDGARRTLDELGRSAGVELANY